MDGIFAHDTTSLLGALSFQEIKKATHMEAHMKGMKFSSWVALSDHVSQAYTRVLTTQALYTCTLVCPVSLLFVHTILVNLAKMVEAFPIQRLL